MSLDWEVKSAQEAHDSLGTFLMSLKRDLTRTQINGVGGKALQEINQSTDK